jgi:hypothetical protein
MNLNDLIQHWVETDLGPHFNYRETGSYYYIRCQCWAFDVAIVRIENKRFCIIDPKKSIEYLEHNNMFGYKKADDITSLAIADPRTSLEEVKSLLHRTHEYGKRLWEEYFVRHPELKRG